MLEDERGSRQRVTGAADRRHDHAAVSLACEVGADPDQLLDEVQLAGRNDGDRASGPADDLVHHPARVGALDDTDGTQCFGDERQHDLGIEPLSLLVDELEPISVRVEDETDVDSAAAGPAPETLEQDPPERADASRYRDAESGRPDRLDVDGGTDRVHVQVERTGEGKDTTVLRRLRRLRQDEQLANVDRQVVGAGHELEAVPVVPQVRRGDDDGTARALAARRQLGSGRRDLPELENVEAGFPDEAGDSRCELLALRSPVACEGDARRYSAIVKQRHERPDHAPDDSGGKVDSGAAAQPRMGGDQGFRPVLGYRHGSKANGVPPARPLL